MPGRWLLILFTFLLFGCAARGVYHTVGKGETLWRITNAYGVDIQEVAEVNNIKNPAEIKAGQRIFMPGAKRRSKIMPYNRSAEAVEKKIVLSKGRFVWPVKGEVISHYGMRDDIMHKGIDIAAERGRDVVASAEGVVVYSDSGMRGYGNVIILRHEGGFFTVYAHNEKNLAKPGDKVAKGERIATVGSSGGAASPRLHFEIREGEKTRNPIFFLP